MDSAGAATAAVLASSQRSKAVAKGGVLDIDTEVRVGDSVSESAPKEDRVTVEAYAMQHYAASGGWTGVHCEGGLFHTLFGLLMWEVRVSIVFACVCMYALVCVITTLVAWTPLPCIIRSVDL